MEGQLVDYYLRNKNLSIPMDHCLIEEVNVYANHPQSLAEKCPNSAEVWYFFTCSRPNEIQPGTDVQGQWVFCEKKDVFNQGEKAGVKQVLEYYEEGCKNKYKIIEYQLDPVPENIETGLWFVCKLYSCMDEQYRMPQLGATTLLWMKISHSSCANSILGNIRVPPPNRPKSKRSRCRVGDLPSFGN